MGADGSSRGARHRQRRAVGGVRQLPWQTLRNPLAPVRVLTDDQIDHIHHCSLRLLADTGMRVLSDAGARQRFAAAGCAVDDHDGALRPGDRGRDDRRRAVAVHAARPQPGTDLTIGGRNVVFTSVGGPAFANDVERGRRPGTHAEQAEYLRLVQQLDVIHQEGGGPFEAMDLPPRPATSTCAIR